MAIRAPDGANNDDDGDDVGDVGAVERAVFISKRLPRASSSTPLLGRAGQRFNRVKVNILDAEVIRKRTFLLEKLFELVSYRN